jgi:hypothetical protein
MACVRVHGWWCGPAVQPHLPCTALLVSRCTTWFDSISFVKEVTLYQNTVSAQAGHVEAWMGPLREESAREGFHLRVEDMAGHVGDVLGPLWPLSKVEGAQRAAINNSALSDFSGACCPL